MAPEARTDLAASPSSAQAARAFVRQLLELWDCEDPEDVAVLLTSEVVSNAVLHAATALALEVSLARGVLRVEVADGESTLPTVRAAPLDATGGRGLLLVDALARRWGAEVGEDGGKVVWFELPVEHTNGKHPPR